MTTVLADIPLDQLHDSPFQPRTHYAGLEGLAESIRADGVQQPLKVRPRRPNPLRDDVVDGYELVFGHRRKRAAELAGLATVPCLVAAMTDAEVRAAQMAENIQRENMRAIEEAQGYQVQILADGISQAELARRIGKSPSHVAGRLKLLQLTPSVRQALDDGRVGAEVALLIARVGPPIVQDKALAAIAAAHLRSDLEDGGKRSLRDVRNLLAEKFTLDLKGALFDPEDTTLVLDAGACSACPKRTGNALEWQDVATFKAERDGLGRHMDWMNKSGPDLCTDPDCFDAKKRAHLAREAAKLAEAGHTVVDGTKARQAIDAHGNVKGAYIPLADAKTLLKTAKGAKAPATVTIQDPRTGKLHKAVKRDDLAAAGVRLDAKPAPKGHDYEAERRARQEKAAEMTKQRRELLKRVMTAATMRERTTEELRLLLRHVFEVSGYHDSGVHLAAEVTGFDGPNELEEAISDMVPAKMAHVLLCLAAAQNVVCTGYSDADPECLWALAKLYGIDPDAPAEAAEPATDPAPTPSTAARAAKKGAATKSKAKAAAKSKAQGRAAALGVRYRCPDTGSTWSGRGLQPAWVKAALASGRTLAELEVKGKDQTDKARSAGKGQTDDAGSAGEAERDTRTADMFEEAAA